MRHYRSDEFMIKKYFHEMETYMQDLYRKVLSTRCIIYEMHYLQDALSTKCFIDEMHHL